MRTRAVLVGSVAGLCAGCWLFASIDALAPQKDASASDATASVDADDDAPASPDAAPTCPPVEISPDGGAVAILSGLVNPVAVVVDPAPCGAGLLFWMNGDACGYPDSGQLHVAE